MASPGGNMFPLDLDFMTFAGFSAVALGGLLMSMFLSKNRLKRNETQGLLKPFLHFFYSCFIKPHTGDKKGTQQDALESFYKTQAGAYDATRKILLQGREDMLALVAAQLEARGKSHKQEEIIWVDIGGGTGWNIEAMSVFVNVPEFFSSVYLVDFSPSLCEVARQRFRRLGWKNIIVVCEDASKFRLEDYANGLPGSYTPTLSDSHQNHTKHGCVDLITMSYSLSMMPDYYSIIESLTSLISPDGLIGVVDFYVQSNVDFAFRNYSGGLLGRHVNWFLRTFWRAWFDLDRVGLEGSRRDYLEYKFGTVLNVNTRNFSLGHIPYYIWVGRHKDHFSYTGLPHEIIERIDAFATESPYRQIQNCTFTSAAERPVSKTRSKAFTAAIQNIYTNLPLPSSFYQNYHWRIYYDDQLQKHTQFNNEYIYAFTWEDARVDEGLLNLGPDDVVLAITSAGDNILSYATKSPARIHAVDLNPTQNHLLELKVASYMALPYEDFWRLFGEGKHPGFRTLLLSQLSPYLSSRAFQYWFENAHVFSNTSGNGLYDTGGSRHAIRAIRWISFIFGCRAAFRDFLATKTLNEQRDIWLSRIRPALLSKLVCKLVVSQESFLWAALGVPKNQLAMIESDHAESEAVSGPNPTDRKTRSHAIWKYMVDTFDPVADQTHVGADNPYYQVCMTGAFTRRCHPDYLSKKAYAKLSSPGALDGLQIHTEDVNEVLNHITPDTLTVAVVMDSIDWFDPSAAAAASQITKLNRSLKMGGRVLLRSSALVPWYMKTFEAHGFSPKRVGARISGACIDRVNMYASCWICTKVENLGSSPEIDRMHDLDIRSMSTEV
ncbi:uncharacterized protein N7518_008035 [Penicillium psychrosexuale]|uniref:uncharacterized protein n=1 Tax=Penicillium psychrosexuale TaxID=1002107 RepID=UPI002544EAC7|nr:uncharacterized protein N7518_008035 [Penicillium psychrosexuale]KAJ5791024.1 hypothetical protein N7518_008035 [Penicillium psychrosexuale]